MLPGQSDTLSKFFGTLDGLLLFPVYPPRFVPIRTLALRAAKRQLIRVPHVSASFTCTSMHGNFDLFVRHWI